MILRDIGNLIRELNVGTRSDSSNIYIWF